MTREMATSRPAKSENRLARGLVLLELVDGPAEHAGKLDRDGIGGNAGERAPQVSPAVAAHVREEGAQIAKHGFIVRGAEGRRIDGGWDDGKTR